MGWNRFGWSKLMQQNGSYKYDAFISYRHTEPDKTIAEKLHRMPETFRVPGSLIKKGCKKKVSRAFRDQEELPSSSNLPVPGHQLGTGSSV